MLVLSLGTPKNKYILQAAHRERWSVTTGSSEGHQMGQQFPNKRTKGLQVNMFLIGLMLPTTVHTQTRTFTIEP